jgi:hypothetical protein
LKIVLVLKAAITVAIASRQACQTGIVEHGSKKRMRNVSNNGCEMRTNPYVITKSMCFSYHKRLFY